MDKFIITAEMRDLENQVSLGEISYSRMIEILNEKAYGWHKKQLDELKGQLPIEFIEWYSGMDVKVVMNAHKRWLKEK